MIRMCNRSVGLLAGMLVVSLLGFSSRLVAQEEIRIEPLSGPVYLITGPGGNVAASIGDDGVLLVDAKFEEVSPEIRKAVASVTSGPIRFILNTHWHHDHTDGNQAFGKEAVIVAQKNVRMRLVDPSRSKWPALPPHAWPVVTFDDSIYIHFNGERIELRHFKRAHTDGDAVIYFTGTKVVHLGDIFFNGSFPFVDLRTGGNAVHLAEVVDRIIPTIPRGAKIIPGHGPVATLQDLVRYRDMLKTSVQRIKAAMAEGKSLEQIQKANPLKDLSSWGNGFISTDRWIELVYRSLQKL